MARSRSLSRSRPIRSSEASKKDGLLSIRDSNSNSGRSFEFTQCQTPTTGGSPMLLMPLVDRCSSAAATFLSLPISACKGILNGPKSKTHLVLLKRGADVQCNRHRVCLPSSHHRAHSVEPEGTKYGTHANYYVSRRLIGRKFRTRGVGIEELDHANAPIE